MLVRAVFAIRNRNGGFVVIGFNNETLHPEPYNLTDTVKTIFHVDAMQGLISKYAFEKFEIGVSFREKSGQFHPVIVVPEGVKVPAIINSGLSGNGGNKLLVVGDIFFRTLNANGTPSSAKALPRDYPDMLEICFENREADIGRFLRRHLGSGDIAKLLSEVSGLSASISPTLKDRSFFVIDQGETAFEAALGTRPMNASQRKAAEGLTMHVGLVLDPEMTGALPTTTFMNTVAGANPQYTGWPVWLDSRGFHQKADRPRLVDNTWQTLIVDLDGGWSQHMEFMRLDPKGEFYLRRAMQDDLSDKITPGVAMDAVLMLYRVAEVLAVGVSIGRAIGWPTEGKAAFAFRWTGLAGRKLSTWANPRRFISSGGTSATGTVDGFTEVTLDTPHIALAPKVREAVSPLFAAFDGYEPSMELIEDCVRRLVERKMN